MTDPSTETEAANAAAAAESAAARLKAASPPEKFKSKYPSIDDYIKLYPLESPHPWVHYVKAIPMGGDRVPMNHTLDVLNMIAIHLQRLGFQPPDPNKTEIKYQAPENGPNVVYNPGTWVPADQPIPEPVPGVELPPELLDITLEGVPEQQLAVLKQAVRAEEIRRVKVANADPASRAEAAAAVTAMPIQVVPVTVPGLSAADAQPSTPEPGSADVPQTAAEAAGTPDLRQPYPTAADPDQ